MKWLAVSMSEVKCLVVSALCFLRSLLFKNLHYAPPVSRGRLLLGSHDVIGVITLRDGEPDERFVLGGVHRGFAGEDPEELAGGMADEGPLVIFFVKSEHPIIAGEGTEEADFEFGIV